MNYQKQEFSDGEILQASHLNYMEEGIVQLNEELGEIEEKIPSFKIAQNLDILNLLFKKRSEEK